MIRKTVIAIIVFALTAVCVFAAGGLANSQVSLPRQITVDSPCPATGCASGTCHGFDDVPEPDGINQMVCPETSSCSSVECHAWDTLRGSYRQASDASMNLWILFPAIIVTGLVTLVSGSKWQGKRRHTAPDDPSADQANAQPDEEEGR